MLNDYKPTHDPNQDTFKVEYLLAGSALLAILFPYKYTLVELLWAFSIWLESVAILPQLFMLQRTGEAESITTHYLFALGAYRALYIPNWIYRWATDPTWSDPIAVIAGIIQTILYSDFFWIYYTKYVTFTKQITLHKLILSQGLAGQEIQPPGIKLQARASKAGRSETDQQYFILS
jgi:ER lumen protein retaining receptor